VPLRSHSILVAGDSARQPLPLRGYARGWYLTELIRIALADGPLSEGERQAALAIGMDLGMTQAQVIGVVAMTEQSAGRD
jgi:hypothetical protein